MSFMQEDVYIGHTALALTLSKFQQKLEIFEADLEILFFAVLPTTVVLRDKRKKRKAELL